MDPITLGLSFSTRMFAYALFKSKDLMDYSLKLHKAPWSQQKRDSIFTSFTAAVKNYTISHIVVSIPDIHQQTTEFNELLGVIESFAFVHRISVTKYPAKNIYWEFGSPVKRTRSRLMKRLCLFYPELERFYSKEQRNRNKYYIKLFEAIGAGAYHLWKGDGK